MAGATKRQQSDTSSRQLLPSTPRSTQEQATPRVAVVGASGHLGANVVRALLASGFEVRAIDQVWSSTLTGLRIQRATADVTDPATLAAAFAQVDVVINLAAVVSVSGSVGGRVEAVNVDGAFNVARACGESGLPLVHCSSVHAFGLATIGALGLIDESSPRVEPGAAAYDRSKWAGEQAVRESMINGLEAVFVNPTGMLGPYDAEPSLAGRTLLSIAKGRMPLTGPGGFDFVDVRDVANGIVGVLRRGRSGESYLLGGEWSRIADLNRMAARLAGRRPPIAEIPYAVAAALAPLAEWAGRVGGSKPVFTPESLNTVKHGPRVDCSKAQAELGFRARPIEDTLVDTYSWFRRAGLLG